LVLRTIKACFLSTKSSGETFISLYDDIGYAFADYLKEPPSLLPIDENSATSDDANHHLALMIPELSCDASPCEPETTPRQEEIENMLIQAYAYVVINIILDLVNKKCEGCIFDHPSQRHHDCLMLENDIKVYRYLTEALQQVNDDQLVAMFMKLSAPLIPALNGLELLKYQCSDARQEIVSRKREELEQLLIEKLDYVSPY